MRKDKILVSVFAFNEGKKIRDTLTRHPVKRQYDLMVVDDGSSDGSLARIPDKNILILRNEENMGIGYAMKTAFNYAIRNNYSVLVIQAGNNKDDPREIPKLLEPIINGRADFVQGSRFLKGGGYGNTPFYRILATKYIHPILMSMALERRVTDSTNGFRAIKLEILKEGKVNWKQNWLNKYELEPYVLFKTIKLGYRYKEVPVTKIYPSKKLSYTKMKPFIGWWSILRPVIYLWLGIKK